MHFFSYEDRSLLYRRKIEKLFRIVNLAVWALQMLLVVIGIVLLAISAEDMFTSSPLAAGGSISLNTRFSTLFSNCSSTTTLDTFLLKKVPFTVDDGNINFLLGLYTEKVIQVIVVACFAVVISFINKLMYDFNFFFIRWKFLIIRKDLIATLDVIFLCGSIAVNAIAHDFAEPLRNHVQHCTEVVANRGTADVAAAISSTSSRDYLSSSNFIPIYIGQCLTLLVYVISFCLLIKHTLIDEEVPEAPEEDEDEDDNEDEDPMPDAKQMRPPQETLDIQKEERILEMQRQRAQNHPRDTSDNNNRQQLYLTDNNQQGGGIVDSPFRNANNNNNNNNDEHHHRTAQQKVRGGFAAMRAAAAFRNAATSSSSSPNNGGKNKPE